MSDLKLYNSQQIKMKLYHADKSTEQKFLILLLGSLKYFRSLSSVTVCLF